MYTSAHGSAIDTVFCSHEYVTRSEAVHVNCFFKMKDIGYCASSHVTLRSAQISGLTVKVA